MKRIIIFYFILSFIACKPNEEDQTTTGTTAIAAPQTLNYTILNIFPHDTASYTQGLVWGKNELYEGTGLYNESVLRINDMKKGTAKKEIKLPNDKFGEGITLLKDKIYQLTWQDHIVYVYDATTLKKIKEFTWPYEGWGLTHNDTQLIISTGGSNIYFVNPETFKIEKTVGVSNNNGYVDSINELEMVDGVLYANKYLTNDILKIDPNTGTVMAKANLQGILEKNNQPMFDNTDVLNGIAYNPTSKTFYITGKKWPALFEIKFN